MPHKPQVSVVLPTYNRADVLPRSIQSVLSQSFSDFELIVVDDASEDETYKVVRGFDDPRIRYYRSEKNVGGAEARNIGIREAVGELVAFQDSDDEWRPEKLERCVSALAAQPQLAGVFSAFWQINGKRARYMPIVNPPAPSEKMRDALLWENFVGTPTVVVHRSVLEEAGGFDPGMPRYQDWELFVRLSGFGCFLFLEEPLILSYCMPNSITRNQLSHKIALQKIYEKNRLQIENNKKLKAAWLSRIGDAQITTDEPIMGRKNLMSAFFNDPVNPRYVAKSLLSAFGSRVIYTGVAGIFKKRTF